MLANTILNEECQFLKIIFQVRPPYQVEKKKETGVPEVDVSEEGVYCKIVFLWSSKM